MKLRNTYTDMLALAAFLIFCSVWGFYNVPEMGETIYSKLNLLTHIVGVCALCWFGLYILILVFKCVVFPYKPTK